MDVSAVNRPMVIVVVPKTWAYVVGFLRGTLRIPREDWGTLGNIREN